MVPGISDNEEMLLHLIRESNAAAMRTLYCRYVRYLTAVCSRYIAGDEDVKDVLQDAFLKIFSSIGSFKYRGEGSLKAWMTKIVLNEALKFLRQNSRLRFVELKAEAADIPEEAPVTEGIPASIIHAMIRELPDGYRTIFNLYIVENKSHREIADLLAIKESTSASQLHRAKAMLAEKIKRYRTYNSPFE